MYKLSTAFMLGFLVALVISIALDARAQDEVVYCTNDGGQTIVTIKKGYACPFGWYEIQL